MKKILVLRPDGNDGCTWYRIKQFANYSREHELLDVQFLDFSLPVHEIAQYLDKADLLFVRLSDIIAHSLFDEFDVSKLNKPIVLDIDDNYDIVDPLSDFYQVYGTQNIKLNDTKYLWKDGINGFDIAGNKKRLESFHNIMRNSTAVIVTTFTLKNYANQFNPNVVVIPNAINFDLFPQVKRIDNDKQIRILFSGGSSHYPDLIEIAPTLGAIMREFPNTYFYFYGVPFEGIIRHLPKERVIAKNWIGADAHGYRLACTDADIGICPLKDMPFNTYKSSIKYYELSALGVASIMRNIAPYTDDVRHEYSGLLYNSPEEFGQQLRELVKNPIKRLTLAQNAYTYVKENRNIETISQDWAAFLSGVIGAYKSRPCQNKFRVLLTVLNFNGITGSEMYVYELGRELVRLGCEVTIAASTIGGFIARKAVIEGIKVTTFESLKGMFDVIHGNQYEPTRKALEMVPGIPAIQTIHSENDYLWKWERPVNDKRVKKYISIRPSIAEKLKLEALQGQIEVVYNPIDFTRFNKEGVSDNGKTLFVGKRDKLRSKAIDLTPNVEVIGNPPVWRVEEYTKKCHKTASVYMGRTTIEGWACGKPGIIHEIDGEGNVISTREEAPPEDMSKFDSKKVAETLLSIYKSI